MLLYASEWKRSTAEMHAKRGISFLLFISLPFGIHAEVHCSLPTLKSQHLERDANAKVEVNADVEVTINQDKLAGL